MDYGEGRVCGVYGEILGGYVVKINEILIYFLVLIEKNEVYYGMCIGIRVIVFFLKKRCSV